MAFISCLHISDLHLGELQEAGIEDFYINICNDIKESDQHIDYIICSGDIFYGRFSDKDELIALAVSFFRKLLERINKLSLGRDKQVTIEDIIIVPGNHDIIREDTTDIYSLFRKFLAELYTQGIYEELYNSNFLYTKRIDRKNKIIIIGLNSCAIQQRVTSQDKKWISNLNLDSLKLDKSKKEEIRNLLLASKYEFDDYGEIETDQLTTIFDELHENVEDLDNYRIVATFHHHIYPFPEIYTKYGDSSMIRNFSNVIDYFFSNNVSIILHGHKHASLARPIVTGKYYNNPNKMMHVFSSGTIGSDRGERSFEIINIHPMNEAIDAYITKFFYVGMECQHKNVFSVPPQQNVSIGYIELLEVLNTTNPDLYNRYIDNINESDSISYSYRVNSIIQYLSGTLTVFDNVKRFLSRKPEVIYLLLLSIHYRISILDEVLNGTNNSIVPEKIKHEFSFLINDDIYLKNIYDLLETQDSKNYNIKVKSLLEESVYFKYKKETSYIVAAIHFLDLYLVLTKYGEIYFKSEGIKSKVNFKLKDHTFHINIPVASVGFIGDSDRRCATVTLKCKEPTTHKAAVIMIKSFEERILKIEDAFKEIGLKIYYIKPKIEKQGYDLDNYNFEAYIPKLLPLLTGEHLYKQREVFIRELIQNSIDAINLRQKIRPDEDFPKTINITFSEIMHNDNKTKCIRIVDCGVGMDLYKIERYFTSIGRSYYTSEDYAELLDGIEIKSKPISNFGIGFLSVFLVCKEVSVLTKSFEEESEGIEVNIPNYEGCFFVNKTSKQEPGTEITLYEDEKTKFDFKKITSYIKSTILNPNFAIEIKNYINEKDETILPYSLFESYKMRTDLLFVPFEENSIIDLPYEQIQDEIGKRHYGLLVDFASKDQTIVMNEGIRLSGKFKGVVDDDTDLGITTIYNFPASYIQLDVARERIVSMKIKDKIFLKDFNMHGQVNYILNKQALSYIKGLKDNKPKTKLSYLNGIYHFLGKNNIFLPELYILKMCLLNDKIKVEFVTRDNTDDTSSFYVGYYCYKNEMVLNDIIEKLSLHFEKPLQIAFDDKPIESVRLEKIYNYSFEEEIVYSKDYRITHSTINPKGKYKEELCQLFVADAHEGMVLVVANFFDKLTRRKRVSLRVATMELYAMCCNSVTVGDVGV